jgi:hypothetical protein
VCDEGALPPIKPPGVPPDGPSMRIWVDCIDE